jgi:outer membrane protein assembly factor BamA
LTALLVDGNNKTSRAVIEREIGVTLDKKFDPRALEVGVRRLRATGLFKLVHGRYLGLDDDGPLAYQLQLEEKPSLTLDTAINFSTADLLGIQAELREKNLMGLMVDARAEGRFGLYIGRNTYVRGSLGWPRIWGSDLNLTLSSAFEHAERPDQQSSFLDNLYKDLEVTRTQELSARLNLAFNVAEGLTLAALYELALDWKKVAARISDPEPFAFPDPIRSGALTLRIHYRQLDNPFDPKQGLQASAAGKFGSRWLGGDGDYFVASTGAQAYHSRGLFTLAASLRSAVGFPLDADPSETGQRFIPDRDLIVAGGDRSVRGFEEASIGVRALSRDSSGSVLYVNSAECDASRGLNCQSSVVVNPGLYGLVANVELRMRLFSFWIGELQWAAFADAAYVDDKLPRLESFTEDLSWSWSLRRLGLGVGTGLRYVTPVGPVVIDVASDPTRFPNLRPHILFGYSF